jgi:non-heme chloroperoxidase
MEQSVLLSTGVRMEYVERGTWDGVPVVFLHGVTDSWLSFKPVLERLPSTVHGFAISQRGHGESSRPEAGYTYAGMSQDLKAFLDVMGLPRAVIVGHSMGSMVAQRFAVDHPDRVAALVLMGAFSTIYQHPGVAEFVASAIAPLTDPIAPPFAREWQLSTIARDVDAGFLDAIVRETVKVPARVWRAAFEGFLTTPDFSGKLAAVAVPVLLVWGDRDTYAERSHQDALLGVIRGARLLVYEGAGHALHWEDPARFTRDLVDFLLDPQLRRSIGQGVLRGVGA